MFSRIKEYFKFFTSLPGIKVLNREYNMSKINNNYFINTAMITWYWEGLDKPLVVRMSFIYKNDCILFHNKHNIVVLSDWENNICQSLINSKNTEINDTKFNIKYFENKYNIIINLLQNLYD